MDPVEQHFFDALFERFDDSGATTPSDLFDDVWDVSDALRSTFAATLDIHTILQAVGIAEAPVLGKPCRRRYAHSLEDSSTFAFGDYTLVGMKPQPEASTRSPSPIKETPGMGGKFLCDMDLDWDDGTGMPSALQRNSENSLGWALKSKRE